MIDTEKRRMLTLRTYHFSCGDSNAGPLGLCGSVKARNRKEALAKIRVALDSLIGAFGEIRIPTADGKLDYANLYVSPENVELADVWLEC